MLSFFPQLPVGTVFISRLSPRATSEEPLGNIVLASPRSSLGGTETKRVRVGFFSLWVIYSVYGEAVWIYNRTCSSLLDFFPPLLSPALPSLSPFSFSLQSSTMSHSLSISVLSLSTTCPPLVPPASLLVEILVGFRSHTFPASQTGWNRGKAFLGLPAFLYFFFLFRFSTAEL